MTTLMKVLLFSCGWLAGKAALQAKKGEAEMTFRGTLIETPACSINDGNQVDVNFGERLGINKVDGVNYRQKLNYQISCETNHNDWQLTLSLSGNVATFDSVALKTDKDDLGIRIYQGDKPVAPNSTLEIDLANPPLLEAVPVKRTGATLTEGAFEAWATLRADYQ
ncbi:fimbrial protein [Erwinia sp. AnSW2-5]|uniref:fimbrial protein n=1 Tax=Erwinia sp. AnSW2-5 TaxID=3367692 RepID=UPI00385B9596